MEEKTTKRMYRGSSWYELLSKNAGEKEELNETVYKLIDEFSEFPLNSNMDVDRINERVRDIFGELIVTMDNKMLLGGSINERIKRVNEYYCRKKPTVALNVTREDEAKRRAIINGARTLISGDKNLSKENALKLSAKKLKGVHKPSETLIKRFIELLKIASRNRGFVRSEELHDIGFCCVTRQELTRCSKVIQNSGINIILTFGNNGKKLEVKVENNIEENIKLLGKLGKDLYNKNFDISLEKRVLPDNYVRVIRENNTDTQNLTERVKNILFVVGSLIQDTKKSVSLVEVCTVLRESHLKLIESSRSIMEILKSYPEFKKSLDKSEERVGLEDRDFDLAGFIKKLNPVNEEWIVPVYIGSGLSEEEILKSFPGSIKQGNNIWHLKANKGFESFEKLAILYSKLRSEVDYIIEPKGDLTNKLKLEVGRIMGAIQRHYIEGVMSTIDQKEMYNHLINELEQKYC